MAEAALDEGEGLAGDGSTNSVEIVRLTAPPTNRQEKGGITTSRRVGQEIGTPGISMVPTQGQCSCPEGTEGPSQCPPKRFSACRRPASTMLSMAAYIDHTQSFCAIEKQQIPKRNRIYDAPCPFCEVALPAKGGAVRISIEEGVDDAFEVMTQTAVDRPPVWKRPPLYIGAAIIAGIILLFILQTLNSDSDSDEPTVEIQNAMTTVSSTLLGDGAFIGSGSYAVIEARKAYNSEMDATAVAAKVSVPGINDLCLFWYVGGESVGDGLTIGDTVTREFSVWGADVDAGSPAADWVRALKRSPEGIAAIAAAGC